MKYMDEDRERVLLLGPQEDAVRGSLVWQCKIKVRALVGIHCSIVVVRLRGSELRESLRNFNSMSHPLCLRQKRAQLNTHLRMARERNNRITMLQEEEDKAGRSYKKDSPDRAGYHTR
jgi:hypothetical protein